MKIGKIEKEIPLPPKKMGLSGYPLLDSMEIGDSFLVEYEKEDPKKIYGKVNSFVSNWMRRSETKFTCRKVEKGIRVWRIK